MIINNPTTFSTPDLTLSTSNSSGTAGALRADDTILVYDTTVPEPIGTASAGDTATSARRNHVHGAGSLSNLQTATIPLTQRTAAAGSGDQSITGAGFTPTAAIAFAERHGQQQASWGTADSGKTEGLINAYPTYSHWDKLIGISAGTADYMEAVVKTYDSDGITITWTKGSSGYDVDFTLLLLA